MKHLLVQRYYELAPVESSKIMWKHSQDQCDSQMLRRPQLLKALESPLATKSERAGIFCHCSVVSIARTVLHVLDPTARGNASFDGENG